MYAFIPETEGSDVITDADELEQQRRSAWIRAVLSGKPLSSPGEEWSYSSAGFAILGEIISRASAKPYDQYIMEEIVIP
ncbi:serine hydrolase domain-containing protein, partial [Escherichia coli]|uniref:serine hydrolase domain-containing protein n=1 Tax=Escherichia coli TaxID=562 RepID=UPI00307A140A